MGGAIKRSLINAYFLTAQSYKRMRLTTQVYGIYIYVIISMSKELNFEPRTWVMVVKHVYVQL